MGTSRPACPSAGWGGRCAVGGVWAGEGGDSGTHHPFLLLGLPTPPTAPPSSPLAAAHHRPASPSTRCLGHTGRAEVRSVPRGSMLVVGGTPRGSLAPEDVQEHVAGSGVTPPARRGLSCTIHNALHTLTFPSPIALPVPPDLPGTFAAALQVPSSSLGPWRWTWFTTIVKIKSEQRTIPREIQSCSSRHYCRISPQYSSAPWTGSCTAWTGARRCLDTPTLILRVPCEFGC